MCGGQPPAHATPATFTPVPGLRSGAGAATFRAMRMPIAITLNGERREVRAASVAELLAEIGLDTRKVAVELNEEIVPRSTYAAQALAGGDQLEIVHFIGGG